MHKAENLQTQLDQAQKEAVAADCEWLDAMRHQDRAANAGSTDKHQTGRIAAAWQRREHAHDDVVEIERRVVHQHTGLVAQARAVWRRRRREPRA